MQTSNQNKFYTSISKYYSEIFPYNPAQLNFVKNRVAELIGKQILDIGCATGELASQLAKNGAKVIGIDLNEDLLMQAKSGTGGSQANNLSFQKGDMLELNNNFQHEQFDAVLCFGNTLVHLENIKQVLQMCEGVSSVLKPAGRFLLQILNYDYIVDEKVSALPLIETETIKFIRKYHFENDLEHVHFQTDLVLKKKNETISNRTMLLALRSEELVAVLENAGFSNIELYSDFKQDPFGGNHLPLVVSCRK